MGETAMECVGSCIINVRPDCPLSATYIITDGCPLLLADEVSNFCTGDVCKLRPQDPSRADPPWVSAAGDDACASSLLA